MKTFRRVTPILAGFVATGGIWCFTAIGCSSNSGSTSGGPDATADAEGDGGGDGSSEAQIDSSLGDAPTNTDTGTVSSDTGAAVDSSTPPGDSGSIDSGTLDAPADGPDPGAIFPNQIAAAICSQYASCCGTSADAAAFNLTSCLDNIGPLGFKGNTTGADYYGNGNVTFDQTKAQACLNEIAAIDCTTNQVTGTQFAQLFADCFAAYSGTLSAGAPCANSIECSPGNYCLPVDGGAGDAGATGVCQPLAGVGGACGNLGNLTSGQSVCSYRGGGANGMFCDNINLDAALVNLPASEWTCQQQFPSGTSCWTNVDCASYVCHEFSSTVFQCANAGVFANASTCAEFLIADAGGGG